MINICKTFIILCKNSYFTAISKRIPSFFIFMITIYYPIAFVVVCVVGNVNVRSSNWITVKIEFVKRKKCPAIIFDNMRVLHNVHCV